MENKASSTNIQPLVTVLVPTYNRALYLKESIDSILVQDYPNFEILVLDNNSTDNTSAIVSTYNDTRIKYVKNSRNLGIIGNHNEGLRLARGEFIHLFSDDDLMASHDNLSSKVDIMMKYPAVGVVHSSIITIDSDGNVIAGNWAESLTHWHDVLSSPLMLGSTAFNMLYYKWNFINMPAVLIRRSCLIEANISFNNQLKFLLDWDLWLKLSLFCDFYFMNVPSISYRVHQKNITKSMLNDSYLIELLLMKISLATLFPNIEKIIKEPNRVEAVVKNQLGYKDVSWLDNKKLGLKKRFHFLKRLLK